MYVCMSELRGVVSQGCINMRNFRKHVGGMQPLYRISMSIVLQVYIDPNEGLTVHIALQQLPVTVEKRESHPEVGALQRADARKP